MSVFVCHCHLLYNFIDVLVSSLHNTIHFRPVRGRIMVLDLELFTEFGDHRVVEIHAIVSDNYLGDTVMTNQVMLDKPRHNVLGNSSKRGSLTHFVK